jgi:hypothetical protein
LLIISQGIWAATDDLKFEVTPYIWLPNIEGSLNFDTPSGGDGLNIETGPNDYLESLDFAIMLSAGIRKNRFSVFTDIIYLDFSSEKSRVRSIDFLAPNPVSSKLPPVEIGAGLDTGTVTSLDGVQWTLASGYTVAQTEAVMLDLFGGFRYFNINASVDWELSAEIIGPGEGQVFPRSGGISQSKDLWDGIVGARGRINLGDSNWYLPYYLDIGTGSSDLTWQGVLGVAYVSKWGDIKLAYRHLYYNTDGKLIDDLRLSGPAFGWTFKF